MLFAGRGVLILTLSLTAASSLAAERFGRNFELAALDYARVAGLSHESWGDWRRDSWQLYSGFFSDPSMVSSLLLMFTGTSMLTEYLQIAHGITCTLCSGGVGISPMGQRFKLRDIVAISRTRTEIKFYNLDLKAHAKLQFSQPLSQRLVDIINAKLRNSKPRSFSLLSL